VSFIAMNFKIKISEDPKLLNHLIATELIV